MDHTTNCQRVDDGDRASSRGTYRCLIEGCEWCGFEVAKSTPYQHFTSRHPTRAIQIEHKVRGSNQASGTYWGRDWVCLETDHRWC